MKAKVALILIAILLASVVAFRFTRPTLSGKYIDDSWPRGRVDTWEFAGNGTWSETTVSQGKILARVVGSYQLSGDLLKLTWQHTYGYSAAGVQREQAVPEPDDPEELRVVFMGDSVILKSPVRGRMILHRGS